MNAGRWSVGTLAIALFGAIAFAGCGAGSEKPQAPSPQVTPPEVVTPQAPPAAEVAPPVVPSAEDKTQDSPTPEAPAPDGHTPDANPPDGTTPDGTPPDGNTPDGTTPDGTPDPTTGCDVLGQTGCAPGQKCTLGVISSDLGPQIVPVCADAGPGASSAACQSDAGCAPGLACLGGLCRTLCDALAARGCAADKLCLALSDSTQWGFCEDACSPVTGQGCPQGAQCELAFVLDATLCQPVQGAIAPGQPCDAEHPCQPGAACFQNKCAAVCDAQGAAACGQGDTCVLPILVEQWGICQAESTPDVNERCTQSKDCRANLACVDDACRELCRDDLGLACSADSVCLPTGEAFGVCVRSCDPVENTGCGQGLACRAIQEARVVTCFLDGTVEKGAPCDDRGKPCKAGSACLAGKSGVSTCTELCDPQDSKSCREGKSCLALPTNKRWGTCQDALALPCDPWLQTGCSAGQACIMTTAAGKMTTACVPAGVAELGQSCQKNTNPCRAGLQCAQGICRHVCEGQSGQGCDPDEACNQLPSIPWGVCLPLAPPEDEEP